MTTAVPIGRQNLVLRSDNRIAVARMGIGLTCYLEPGGGGSHQVSKALDIFNESVPLDDLPWFTTSVLHTWRELRLDERQRLRDELAVSLMSTTRHLFQLRFADPDA